MSTTVGFSHDLDAAVDKATTREQAAHEKRQWVRLTNLCNNKCIFCLDSAVHDGTVVETEDVRALIARGRHEGATRLILSGGEPTMHPEFVDLVALGRRLGYRRVQTVTNGRMFAYPEFLRRCVNAGLQEITFSVHGHNAKVHDALVGVPGAYVQILSGLRNALADGRVVVNVDVCLNRANVPHLPELLDGLLALGVREIDLLHIIPFGDAWRWGKETLFYDIEEAWEPLRYALEVSRRPDVHVWFNRFPPPFLEGWEHLIQDPHKLVDEVRGRLDEYDWWVRRRWPLLCRQPDRCGRCYLQPLCDGFEEHLERLDAGVDGVLRATHGEPVPPLPPAFSSSTPTSGPRTLWVDAPHVAAAAEVVAALAPPGAALWLNLESAEGLAAELGGHVIERVYVGTPADLATLLATAPPFEVVAWLTASIADWLIAHPGAADAPGGLALALPTWERMTEARTHDADLPGFFSAFPRDVPTEGVPQCLSGRPPRPLPPVLDLHRLGPTGRLDPLGFTERFIRDDFRTKSRRCGGCAFDDRCAGVHVNWVRAHGYAALRPVTP